MYINTQVDTHRNISTLIRVQIKMYRDWYNNKNPK